MEVIIVTGLSGAGKSQAIESLEDIGYYCVDNMPVALIKNFIELSTAKGGAIEKAAFVMDVRGSEFSDDMLFGFEVLKESEIDFKIIFLEASDEVLVRRYSETRRRHPLSKASVTIEDIIKERNKIENVRKLADFIIDTSSMKTAELKNELINILSDDLQEETFVINIMSFGFKHGIPISADMVFDMRFIPNPFYIPELKSHTGNDKDVQDYVMKHIEAQMFKKNLAKLINDIIPCYMREGKFHINLAFGCTGGQHRSVTMANEFQKLFELQGKRVTMKHRDVKK
ncbi:MAG: RNase adapter RapZ [Anaerovoracaceae bacterium]